MEMKIKSQVQFNDDLTQRSNITSGDSLSNSFAKIHHDLNDYEIAANIAANDRPKNLLYIYDILSNSVSDATEEILGYPIEAGTYVYSAEIYTVQNPSAANVTKIEFLGSDGNTIVGTCNITCNTKKEEHTEITLSDEAYYIKYYRDTYSSGTVGYLKTSKQMICLPNIYAAFPDYTMYAPSLGETFLEVEDSVKTYDVQDTYDPSSYKAISGKGVYSALESLSASSTGGAGKYISEISEIGGKIEATTTTFDTALSSSGTNSNAPTTKAVYDDQQRQETEIGDVVNRGAKNDFDLDSGVLSAISYHASQSISGDTLTVASSGNWGRVALPYEFKKGTSIFSCTVSNFVKAGGVVLIRFSEDAASSIPLSEDITITGNGDVQKDITIAADTSGYIVYYMNATSTSYINSADFSKNMIRHASITDSTFVPYAKTNVELTNENTSQQSEIDYVVNTGVKNFLDVQHPTTTTRTSYQPLANGGVELSCSNAAWTSYAIADIPVEAGKEYIITFLLDESSGTSNFYFFLRDGNSSGTNIATKNYGSTTGKYEASFTPNNSAIWLGIYLNNSATAVTATAKLRCMIRPAYITDSTYQPYALTNPVITPALIKQVDEGAKNIADFTSATKTTYTTATFHGVTITRNGDIFTISGTSDTNDNAFFNIYYEGSTTTKIIPPGNWVALIEDYIGSVVKDIAVQIAAPAVPPSKPYGTPVRFSLSGSETGNWLRVNLRPSTTYNGSFRLMICSQEDYAISPAFVPYGLPNPVLTPALIEQVDSGAKNLVAWDIPTVRSLNTNATWTSDDTCVKGGITYKFNTDGTVVANGTADTSGSKFIKLKSNFSVAKGLIASCGLPTVSQDQSKGLLQLDYQSGSDLNVYDYEISKEVDRDGTVELYIAVLGGITVSNLIFKPMICTTADWAVSQKFVSYAMSNAELTADMSEVQTGLGAVCVLRKIRNSSATYTYTMSIDDFTVPPSVSIDSCGTYLISIITWSTTPTYSMYTVSYTGGNTTNYNLVQKIAGADANVTCTNGVITVTSSGKVQIYALR